MKTRLCSLASLILLILTIHPLRAQEVLSLNPIFSERDAVLIPEFEGDWVLQSYERDTVSVQRTGDNFYHFRYVSDGESSVFEAGLVQSGNVLLLDLYPVVSDTAGDSFYRERVLGAHTLFRVSVQNDSVRLALLNYRWFYDRVVSKKFPLSYSWINNSLLLTIPTDELRRFIAEQAEEKTFFQDDFVLRRVHQQAKNDTTMPQSQRAQALAANNWAQARQDCVPSFPLKDGWLGGDGDISIPLESSKTPWIFNDTYVGKKEQTSRSGSKMIPNSVAIMACGPNGQSTIKYFWKDQYTDHPKPIFESYTSRYRYWPCAAFMNGNTLYVLLLKIGPKPDAAPDDIFNFKGVGMSLAKISDPIATTPDQWKIELFPWSRVLDPDVWGCSAVEGGYLYMFVKGEKQPATLIRLSLDEVESPEGHTEYYAKDGQWKTGVPSDDARVVLDGDPGYTVCYHADLKQWIMVCGPGFINNRIRIRTASTLIGPWSEEQVIYECPEQTPGSASFEKDKFCYFGREHIEFYNAKNRTLLLTYDCNSADFSKAVSDNSIYSPRTLFIPLGNRRHRERTIRR
jgi:hypothetical protein